MDNYQVAHFAFFIYSTRMQKKKVFVGLSGGVDSALAAAYLVREGYDVTGVFIKIWQPEFVACTWKEDRLAAMRVAVALGIPFETVDLSKEYKIEIIERMRSDYANGITPNPDVLCNRFVKFGAFWEWAQKHGADYVATGHHARIRKAAERYTLLRGVDPAKDQAYFLCRLTQDDLAHTLLPIGHLTKAEVRKEATRLDLPSATRPDSQGLCFVGEVDMLSFLKELLQTKRGDVLNESGEVVGTHEGAALYTLGQRHGFSVKSKDGPYFVVGIDTVGNTITISTNVHGAERKNIPLRDIQWVGGEADYTRVGEAEVRYHQKPQKILNASDSQVEFMAPQLAVPGQFCVFYAGEECLGSGIIE